MTATCLNKNGIAAVLRICRCAAGSIVFHGRKTTALSFTVSTALKTIVVGKVRQGNIDAPNPIGHPTTSAALAIQFALDNFRAARAPYRASMSSPRTDLAFHATRAD